MHIDIMM